MNWTTFTVIGQLANNDIIALDGGDMMGQLIPYNDQSNSGTFVQQISVGNNVSHVVNIDNNGEVKKTNEIILGNVTHLTKEGFPQGGVLIRPQ